MSLNPLEILKYPDPRLTKVSTKVAHFDTSLHALLDAMIETMYAANGIGLAAPQVNQPVRAFVIDLQLDEEGKKVYEFVNPKLHDGEGKVIYEEGCLSVPGLAEEVTRKAVIFVDYQDRRGRSRTMRAEGLLAVAIQHENDHLDGILFVDRLPLIKRRLAKRKLAKTVTL